MKLFKNKNALDLSTADLSYVVYKFLRADDNKHHKEDVWRVEDAVRGLQIYGGVGSGKSSSSGRQIALSYLHSGYGGIVCTGKVNETNTWIEYAKQSGRLDDLVVFSPGGPYQFNPLDYELNRDKQDGGGHTENIISLFMSLAKMSSRLEGNSTLGNEPFWKLAMERCLRSTVDLLKLAGKSQLDERTRFDITIDNFVKVLRDTPKGHGHYSRFFNLINPSSSSDHNKLQAWAEDSFTVYALIWAAQSLTQRTKNLKEDYHQLQQLSDKSVYEAQLQRLKNKETELEDDTHTFEVVSSYFLSELPTLAEKTKSGILEHFFAFASPFRTGVLSRHFARGTSAELMPERTFESKVIILDFPVKKHLQLGIYAQSIYRKIWQQAVERRAVNKSTKPVFMWIDESQYFVNSDDMVFQTTARESKACTVLITQNISNYYALMGANNSKAFVDSLMGVIGTKIFHNNSDAVMNEWASEVISKDYRGNLTASDSGMSVSDEYQYQFLPMHFSLLKTGGVSNEGIVEAVISMAGKKWSTKKNFLKVIFKQDLK